MNPQIRRELSDLCNIGNLKEHITDGRADNKSHNWRAMSLLMKCPTFSIIKLYTMVRQ